MDKMWPPQVPDGQRNKLYCLSFFCPRVPGQWRGFQSGLADIGRSASKAKAHQGSQSQGRFVFSLIAGRCQLQLINSIKEWRGLHKPSKMKGTTL